MQTPSEEFTPIPFWFFNDTPDEDRMRKQLEDYVKKGVNGIVLHPRIGVPKEVSYLSDKYFQAVRFVVKTAAQLDMKIVLYDEGMYPSGSAHGMVVAKNPDYASKGITLVAETELESMRGADTVESSVSKSVKVITQFSDGKYLVYTFTGGTIRGIHFGEDDVEEELYFHIPGQDLIMRRVSPQTGGLTEFDSVQAKLPADIARHLGRRRNANECFGVCFRNQIPWYFKAEDMKWYIDWLGIRGVNLFVPHAFYYSIAGARKEERPPDVGPNNIWWPHYRRFSDYMKRLSFLMTDSINGAKVAVLCHNNQVPYKELAVLFEKQVEFNYLPIALLAECKMKGGKLCIKEYGYEAVLNVTNEAWDKAVEDVFKKADGDGTRVPIFHSSEELVNAGKGQEENVLESSNKYAVVHVVSPCRNLRVSALQKLSVQMYLFSNEGQEALETEVVVQGRGTPVLVDLWRGDAGVVTETDVYAEERIAITISLQPRETALIIMDEDGSLTKTLKPVKPSKSLGDLTTRFTQVEKKENLAVYTMDYMADTVTGTETIQVKAEEMVELYCNDELADVAFWSPYNLRVGQFLKEGKNELKLKVTGNAANVYCNAEIPYGLL